MGSYNLFCLVRILVAMGSANFQKVVHFLARYKYLIISLTMATSFAFPKSLILSESLQSFLVLLLTFLMNSKSASSSQPEPPPVLRQRRRTRDEDERVLELIEQGYFLYRQTNIQPFTSLNLVYTNRKGKEVVCQLDLESDDVVDSLGQADEPNKSLRELITDLLKDEVPVGSVEKTMLTPRKNVMSENSVSQSVPFKFFKGELWKLTKSEVLIIIDERSGKKTLSLLEGLRTAIVCTLSHELKTLANGITGNIELMADDNCLNKEQKLNHGIALCSSYLLGSRLKDLLDYIQLQNRGFKLHYTEFVIDDVLDNLNV